MLTQVEAQDIYAELVQILQDLQLGWLVRQVEEQLSYGRLRSDVKTKVYKSSPDPQRRTYTVAQTKATATLSGAEEFTETERLRTLTEAIRTIAVHSVEVEEAVIQFFSDTGKAQLVQQPDIITFSDGEPQDEKIIAPDGNQSRRRSLADLLSLLDELEREI